MRASCFALLLLAAAGCQPQGAVVHVFVDATPAIGSVSLVTVNSTVGEQRSKKVFTPAAPTQTPLDFGLAFPASLAGKTAEIEVELSGSDGAALGKANGSVPVPPSGQSTELHLAVGGGDSLCGTDQTIGPLCDGFEGQLMNFWNAPVTQNAADRASAVEVVAGIARRGTHSLHVSVGAIEPNDLGSGLVIAALNETSYLPDNLFARMFVYVPSAFNTSVAGAVMIVENSTTFAQLEVSIENQGLSVYDSIDGSQYPASGTLPYDGWHCIELQVQKGNPGAIHLWLDDAPVLSQGGVNTSGDFNMLAVGLVDTLIGSPDRELWIDEVAVDSQRITCAK